MKSHPKSRVYVGKQLEAQDELEAITRRQYMRVIARADVDRHTRREYSRKVASLCLGLVLAAMVVAAIVAVVTGQ